MTRSSILAVAALTLFTIGCGSGDDDTGSDIPAAAGDDAPAPTDAPETGDAPETNDAPAAEGATTENISGGTGTVTIGLPDGRTEARDVDCSIYTDQFETTFEYSDILDDDQSVNFYYREEGDTTSDVTFNFKDPQLGGLAAYNVVTASNTSISGANLSVDLSVLIVGSTDDVGNPEMADVTVTGTCAP